MKESNAVKKQRYGKALYTYGIVPVLLLLEEYEKTEDFEECSIIRDAIQDRVDYVNSMAHLGEDFDFPRHMSELDPNEGEYEFLEEGNFKHNVKNYVRAIKELVNTKIK